MPRVAAPALVDFAAGVLESLGTPPAAARQVAEHLVESNLAGHPSHGVLRLKQYYDHAREGYAVPAATPTVSRETATTAVVDGHWGWGPAVVPVAMELAIAKAQTHSIGAVAVRGAYHVGRVGAYAVLAAEAGLMAQIHCNTHGVARAAPWGGKEARLATNPIAVAVPTRGEPIVADMATTAVAEGKVRLSKFTGQSVPTGWVVDAEGRPDTDPNTLYTGGTLALLGGDQGHKGYCLSVVTDLFGGVLTGAGYGTSTDRYGNGLFIQVIDPAAFFGEGSFADAVEAYVKHLKSAATCAGVDAILMPGEKERRALEAGRTTGVDIPRATWDDLEKLARASEVALPEVAPPR